VAARAELTQLQSDTQKLLVHAAKLKAIKKSLANEVHTLRAARTIAHDSKLAADRRWYDAGDTQRTFATQRRAFIDRVRHYDAIMVQCSPEGLARHGVPPLLSIRRADDTEDDLTSPSSSSSPSSSTSSSSMRRTSRASSSDGTPQWDLRTVTPSKMTQEQLIELSTHCLTLLQRDMVTLQYGDTPSTVDMRTPLLAALTTNNDLRQKSNQYTEHIMNLTKAKLERFEQKFDKTRK
jgi:hypothetical protein